MRAALVFALLTALPGLPGTAWAQDPPAAPGGTLKVPAGAVVDPVVPEPVVPADYVIGADDVLAILFWRDKEMSGEVVVRPDGKITLPLINDVVAAGLTPDALRQRIVAEATRFLEEPSATVVVKQINSRKVFITGEINKPGPYSLTSPVSVIQLISLAGGLREYANQEQIVIMRVENGKPVALPFDYAAVAKGKKLQQNIMLKPGDTVLVP